MLFFLSREVGLGGEKGLVYALSLLCMADGEHCVDENRTLCSSVLFINHCFFSDPCSSSITAFS